MQDAKTPLNGKNLPTGGLREALASGTAESVVQALEKMIERKEGENENWHARSVSLLHSMIPPLVWLRDNKGLQMSDLGGLREMISFTEAVKMSRNAEIPAPARETLQEFLRTLSDYDDSHYDEIGVFIAASGGDEQATKTQFNYLSMRLQRELITLQQDGME